MPIRDARRLRAPVTIAVVSLLALLVLAAVSIVISSKTKVDVRALGAAP